MSRLSLFPQYDLAQVIKEAMEAEADSFVELFENATHTLQKEEMTVANFQVLGRHVKLNPESRMVVVSDLHGDLESLVDVLKKSNVVHRMNEDKSACIIFLGDYGDRGPFSAEVYYAVLKLKLQYAAQVVLMRGNHEGPPDLFASPHDLPSQFETRFRKKWRDVYDGAVNLFSYLYTSASVEKRCLLVHGGLPEQARKLEDFAYAHKTHPNKSFLEEILWSDPSEELEGVSPSPRGAGRLFGKDVTRKVLDSLGLKIMIRGHEPCTDGFEINHDGKILTLFSRKGDPYFNQHGAYLDVDLSCDYSTAYDLIPYIHKF